MLNPNKFRWVLSLATILFTLSCLANTSTELTITKKTTLTDQDAQQFMGIFGKQFQGDRQFHFNCHQNQCTITALIAGFSGEPARNLLRGRPHAKFTSRDKSFVLGCGKTSVFYCNVIQRQAVLTS